MTDRRVVVTGMGVLACNGRTVAEYWDALKNGRHGIGRSTQVDPAKHGTTFAGEVKYTSEELAGGDVPETDALFDVGVEAAAGDVGHAEGG